MLPDRVGLKAWGLSCLPTKWVPAFCVLDESFAKHVTAKKDLALLHDYLEAIDWYNFDENQPLIVRSSAVNETILSRGHSFLIGVRRQH